MWPEILLEYPAELRARYCEGIQFGEWYREHRTRRLFCPKMFTSKQIPHSGPVKQPIGFHELLLGSWYLDAGYEALFLYREAEDQPSYEIACDLFGGVAAAQFINPNSEKGGRPPDLLVYEPATYRFRFVECKGHREAFTKSQVERFTGIERYLNTSLNAADRLLSDTDRPELFPPLQADQWIHIARLSPT